MRQWIRASIMGYLCMQAVAWGAVGTSPVVVELFESQGCSSCPPSERAMERLAQEFGNTVIPLGFHVDYWDHLGWNDTFSDKRYTDRQIDYGRVFGQESIYTPEMVIQGREGFNGSDLSLARQAVRARLNQTRPSTEITLLPARQKVRLTVHLSPELAKDAKVAEAVIYENAQPVKILRGENAGEIMSGRFAVRHLQAIKLESGRGTTDLALEAGWNPSDLGVAVLVRNAGTSILSAQNARWPIYKP